MNLNNYFNNFKIMHLYNYVYNFYNMHSWYDSVYNIYITHPHDSVYNICITHPHDSVYNIYITRTSNLNWAFFNIFCVIRMKSFSNSHSAGFAVRVLASSPRLIRTFNYGLRVIVD